jgi:sulfite oxidase
VEKARATETLLAYEMNGAPLTPAHGYPLRVITPGYIGARSVKWLKEIVVRADGSKNYFYNRAYQLFPPQARPDNVDWENGIKLGELSVNSVICTPLAGARLQSGPLQVEGYSFAGGGRRIERVDVSIDGGRTWQTAALEDTAAPWAWRFWRAGLDLAPGAHEIICRAWDSAANTQPEAVRDVWNFKGYMNNAWHRVRVDIS